MRRRHAGLEPLPADPVEWGDHQLLVDVAGGPYLFSGLSEDQRNLVRRRFDDFLLDPASAPLSTPSVRFLRASPSCFEHPDLDGLEYPLTTSSAAGSVTVDGLRFSARLRLSPGIGGDVWTSVAADEEFLSVFENPFRVLVAYRLLEIGGAVLHSAAVVDHGRADVFYGRSGAGKSTLSHRAAAAGRRVLSDDLNTLHRAAGTTLARPVPFAGDLRDTAFGDDVPVRSLLRIEHGDRVRFRATSPAVSLASLIACSPFVNGDGLRRPALEANLERAQRSLTVGVLTLPRDADYDEIVATIGEVT